MYNSFIVLYKKNGSRQDTIPNTNFLNPFNVSVHHNHLHGIRAIKILFSLVHLEKMSASVIVFKMSASVIVSY